MRQVRPWHRIQVPGMCGIKVTTCILTLFSLVMSKPAPQPVKPPVIPAFEPDIPSWDETAWMGNEGVGKGGTKPEVDKAMRKCQGNKACTLALLQKQELKINTSCWLCLQMSHAWKTVPLTVATINETDCLIPKQMTEVLRAAADIEQGKIPTKHPTSACKRTQRYNHTDMSIPPLRVMHVQGDVCVCSQRLKLNVNTGWSDCRVRIDIKNSTTGNCTAVIDGITTDFTCPFSKPGDTSPAAVWVCGDRAYHFMPHKDWTGCCYPALMNVGTSVYFPDNEKGKKTRQKRDIVSEVGTLPNHYNGYVLSDPWTTPGANVGWSIFLGVGTAVTINKINGLAWSVLALANSTEHAMTMVNEEMRQIRDAVIQNRLILDMLTAEKGGACKMLGMSCCFHIPDYSDNITNIINHMRAAVREPEKADNSWFGWITNLRVWGHWLCYTVLPIFAIVALVLLCLPCIFQCISSIVQRMVKTNMSQQMGKLTVYDDYNEWMNEFDEMFSEETPKTN